MHKSTSYGGYHYKVRAIRGNPKKCDECKTTMTNQIKNFILEGEKEFKEKFDALIYFDGTSTMGNHIDAQQEVFDWHKQRQISLIKMIVEIVESEIDRNIKIDKMQDGLKTENKVDTSVFLETLKDTISSKLKEIINTPSL